MANGDYTGYPGGATGNRPAYYNVPGSEYKKSSQDTGGYSFPKLTFSEKLKQGVKDWGAELAGIAGTIGTFIATGGTSAAAGGAGGISAYAWADKQLDKWKPDFARDKAKKQVLKQQNLLEGGIGTAGEWSNLTPGSAMTGGQEVAWNLPGNYSASVQTKLEELGGVETAFRNVSADYGIEPGQAATQETITASQDTPGTFAYEEAQGRDEELDKIRESLESEITTLTDPLESAEREYQSAGTSSGMEHHGPTEAKMESTFAEAGTGVTQARQRANILNLEEHSAFEEEMFNLMDEYNTEVIPEFQNKVLPVKGDLITESNQLEQNISTKYSQGYGESAGIHQRTDYKGHDLNPKNYMYQGGSNSPIPGFLQNLNTAYNQALVHDPSFYTQGLQDLLDIDVS